MTRILSRPYDQHAADRLALSGFLPPIARALAARGIQVPSDLEQEWAGMLPPAMLEGTREAAERLALARERHQAVTIVADYDCDGATACAVGIRGLRMLGITANYFVPDRVLHGYGLTPNVVDIVAARTPKPDLIVTVDNGISSAAAVDRARELSIDVIITDHHLPGAELPRAQAIVNPNLTGSTFPSKNLAGVGVIYYVLLALRSLLRERGVFDAKTQPRLDALVDFVALGTVADVVKLDKNNRILVSQGIRRIRCGRTHAGLEALFAIAGRDIRTAGVRDFGFAVAPRINAAGRMGAADTALQLLRSKDHVEALRLAQHLDALNTQRREEEERIWAAAREQAHRQLEQRQRPALVLYGGDWHPGIVGIVASRIVEEFYRPTIILCDDNNMMKGSGRSIREFDLYAGLQKTAHVLAGFGGHKLAAGVRLEPNQLERFREAFERVVADELGEQPLTPALLLECELDFQQASDSAFLQELELMQPFGAGNAEPVFASPELTVVDRSPLGYSGDHVRLRLKDSASGITLMAKGWNMATAFPPSSVGSRIRVAYTPRLDYYRGVASIDVGIKDWQPVAD